MQGGNKCMSGLLLCTQTEEEEHGLSSFCPPTINDNSYQVHFQRRVNAVKGVFTWCVEVELHQL